MAKTTISVDSAVRDRLAALAGRHGRSLGDEIASLLDRAEQAEFWEDVSAGYARFERDDDRSGEEFPEYGDLQSPGPLATPEDLRGDHGLPDDPRAA